MCIRDRLKLAPGTCGCGVADTDADSDGTPNCNDQCPSDANKTAPGACGCGVADTDSDSDGTPNCNDLCPSDALKTAPGACGCGVADTDSDSDGTANCLDPDDDGDGTPDVSDGCPLHAAKTSPGICGCGVSDSDTDADGLVDCLGVSQLAQVSDVVPTDRLAGDQFGYSVSTDGTTLVVGMPFDDVSGVTDAGSVRVFTRSGSSWTQSASLSASDRAASDNFGFSVSVSGDVLVVGAPAVNSGSIADVGAAYVYRRSGSAWIFETRLLRTSPVASDRFGGSVAALGDFVAVGAGPANASGLTDCGEVRVYRRASGVWSLTSTLFSSPIAGFDRYGESVALGGDPSSPLLAVGAYGDDEGSLSNCGAVYLHQLNASGVSTSTTRLIGAGAISGMTLGTSVAVDVTGTMVVAGAPSADTPGVGTDCGMATVWELSGGTWVATNLVAADRVAGERLGASVCFASDGLSIALGAPADAVGGVMGRGSVAVFSYGPTGWRMHDRLTLSGGTSAADFGAAVTGCEDQILVGAPRHTLPGGGAVRAYGAP